MAFFCFFVEAVVSANDNDVIPIKKSWKVAVIVVAILAFLNFGGFLETISLQGQVDSKIDKAVITKKVTRHTTWNQDENGDYYFGKYRVAEDDVSVTRHHPKLSKPYAKVKTTYISNRFTKSQKTKIYKALNITDTKRLGNKATINK